MSRKGIPNHKTRGNYRVVACIRFDCANRDIACKHCICHNKYITNKQDLNIDGSTNG